MFRKAKSIITSRLRDLFKTLKIFIKNIDIIDVPTGMKANIIRTDPIILSTKSLDTKIIYPVFSGNTLMFDINISIMADHIININIESPGNINPKEEAKITGFTEFFQRRASWREVPLISPANKELLDHDFAFKRTRFFKVRSGFNSRIKGLKNLNILFKITHKGTKAGFFPKKDYIRLLLKMMNIYKFQREEIKPVMFFKDILIWDRNLIKFTRPNLLSVKALKNTEPEKKHVIIAKIKKEKYARLFII